MTQIENPYDCVPVEFIPSVSEYDDLPPPFLHGSEVPVSMEMREIQGSFYDNVAVEVEAPLANGSLAAAFPVPENSGTNGFDGYRDRRCGALRSQENEFDDTPQYDDIPQTFTDHRNHVTCGHVNDGEVTQSEKNKIENNENNMFITNKNIYSKCCIAGFSILVLLIFVLVGLFIAGSFYFDSLGSALTKPKGCPQPVAVENGTYSPNISSQYNVGSNVTYRCLNGSKLCGEASIVCKDQGIWSSFPPSCLKECVNKLTTDSELVKDYTTTERISMTNISKTNIFMTTVPMTNSLPDQLNSTNDYGVFGNTTS